MHVPIISTCGNTHQWKHWLAVNQPVLPLINITTTITPIKHSIHCGDVQEHVQLGRFAYLIFESLHTLLYEYSSSLPVSASFLAPFGHQTSSNHPYCRFLCKHYHFYKYPYLIRSTYGYCDFLGEELHITSRGACHTYFITILGHF